MKGTVSQLVNGRYGVFIEDGTRNYIFIAAYETLAEAEKAAENIPPRSHFVVYPKMDGWTVSEVRIGDFERRLVTTHTCSSPGELHRLKLRLIDQGLYEALPSE